MQCIDFKYKIVESLGGESASDQNLQHHLKECSSCKKEYSEFSSVRKMFSYLPNLAPEADSVAHLLRFSRAYVFSAGKRGSVGHFLLVWLKTKIKFLSEVFVDRFSPAPAGVFAMMLLAVLVTFYPGSKVDKVDKVDKIAKSESITNGVDSIDNKPLESPLLGASSKGGSSSLFDLRQVAVPQVVTPQADPSTLLETDLPQIQLELPELEKRWEERRRQMLEADADSLMMRGRRFKAMGRVDMALNDFETIYRFYPDYSYMGDVLMYRAQCYAFQGNIDKALESLMIFTEKYPSKKSLVLPMINQLESEQHLK